MNSQGCEFGALKAQDIVDASASHFPHCVGVPAAIQYGHAERPRESCYVWLLSTPTIIQ